jgi:hypothetical protein
LLVINSFHFGVIEFYFDGILIQHSLSWNTTLHHEFPPSRHPAPDLFESDIAMGTQPESVLSCFQLKEAPVSISDLLLKFQNSQYLELSLI